MASSDHFPPVNSSIYTNSMTMNEASTGNSIHGGASAKSSKPPQPPLYIPPGHVAFHLLGHASRIGGLIGKSGSIIKQLQQLTNSKIRVEDPTDTSDNRIISVLSSSAVVKRIKLTSVLEENDGGNFTGNYGDGEWFDVSAAQEGIIRVFERLIEMAAEGDAAAGIGGVISCRLLVSKNQGGAVIGKGGKVVEKIRKDTGSRIKVLPMENLSSGSLPLDQIVEIEGLALAVKKALLAITYRLQEFPPLEKTRMYATRPLESESLPIQTVDLPLERSPMLQPMLSDSINDAWEGGPSESEKASYGYVNSRTPQEVVFQILCPNERVGGIIGKGGSIVKALQSETGVSISVGPTLADCDERLITITAMESAESEYSPAQKATIVIFNRSVEAGIVKGLDSGSIGSPISARLVVPTNQVGCLLGKGGATISEMRKLTGAGLRIFWGNRVPKCASVNDEVIQITGEFANVQDALHKVTGRLRENTFSVSISTGNGNRNSLRTENGAYNRVRDYPPFRSHSDNLSEQKSLTWSMDHLAISNNEDQLPSLSSLTSVNVSGGNEGNIRATGQRLPPAKGGVELGSGSRSAIMTDTNVEIVPDAAIGSIYGENGSNLAMVQQISGAKVTVREPHPGTTQRSVVISGTPDEMQAAQSLLQAFMLAVS